MTVVAPSLLAVLLLFHPLISDPFEMEGRFGAWYAVHYGMYAFIPLLGAAGWLMVDGMPGRLAQVARWSVFPFTAFYAAWEALTGIGTAWLVEDALVLGPEQREVVAPLINDWWSSLNGMHWMAVVGIAAWLVFGVAAALAHRRAGSHPLVVWGLAVGSLFAALHGSLQGAIPLWAFAAAGWKLTRPTSTAGRPPA